MKGQNIDKLKEDFKEDLENIGNEAQAKFDNEVKKSLSSLAQSDNYEIIKDNENKNKVIDNLIIELETSKKTLTKHENKNLANLKILQEATNTNLIVEQTSYKVDIVIKEISLIKENSNQNNEAIELLNLQLKLLKDFKNSVNEDLLVIHNQNIEILNENKEILKILNDNNLRKKSWFAKLFNL